jgi:N6-adenosine-specific RNA methylase IME4
MYSEERNSRVTGLTLDRSDDGAPGSAPLPSDPRLGGVGHVAGRYRTIYLNPVCAYRDWMSRGSARRRHPAVGLKQLLRLPVRMFAADDGCLLWYWTDEAQILAGWPRRLFEEWGFEPLRAIVWSVNSLGDDRCSGDPIESILLGVRGKVDIVATDVPIVERARKRRNRGEKPEQFRRIIERLSPGPRLEFSTRIAPPGWDTWNTLQPDRVIAAAPNHGIQERLPC